MSAKTHYSFVCKQHQEYGSLGWRLENMPAFDPLSGVGVAHDILEHRPNDDSTTGEIMALGAMVYVRGEDYHANAGRVHTRPSYHMHGELAELMLNIHREVWVPLKDCPYSQKCDAIQDEIDETVRLIKSYLVTEYEDVGYEISPEDEGNIRGWLAEGYRSAVRRYKKVSRSMLLNTFCLIEEEADKQLKFAEEGYKLHVSLKWNAGIPDLKIRLEDCYG